MAYDGANTAVSVRILIINPNSTPEMTENCLLRARQCLPSHISVEGLTAPKPAPTAVEGYLDNVMSSAAALRALKPVAYRYDAFLVACYSDHALIRMIREEFESPCVGIMEASLYAARTVGARFGILATSFRSKFLHEDAVRHYGLGHFCAGIAACSIGVLELEKPEVVAVVAEQAKVLARQGADSILLGCAGMTTLHKVVKEAVGSEIQVIDGVLAGMHHLAGLVTMGLTTSKAGAYTSSMAYRERRGQDYL